jgi:hypothetical protein
MAYYIFLKSLRSLEQFRKNPHVKIPPKSHSTNFQSLGKLKKKSNFEFRNSFSRFRPDRPCRPSGLSAQPAHWLRCPRRPKPSRPAHPARASVTSSREIRIPFWFASSEPAASPTSLCQPGPRCQFHPHLQPPELTRATTDSRSPSVAQLRASGAIEPLPPRLHFLSLNFPP